MFEDLIIYIFIFEDLLSIANQLQLLIEAMFYASSHSGSIVSPNFPYPYPAKSDVNYTIETTQGSKIDITFDNFSIEDSHPNCTYDKLK